jgi:hypothetical protein
MPAAKGAVEPINPIGARQALAAAIWGQRIRCPPKPGARPTRNLTMRLYQVLERETREGIPESGFF